uniref:Uncharacterized protein n=1 Tax=Glossina austeni TaxID=7395 RepID=A0A1A9VYP3_GLOAU
MDVFKLDLEEAQIGSSLLESSSNTSQTNKRQEHLGVTGGAAGKIQDQHSRNTVDGDNLDEEDNLDEKLPEVSFDANSDFNLHFFDTPEDSSTQGGFSDAGSAESETDLNLESPVTPTGAISNANIDRATFTGEGERKDSFNQLVTHSCQTFYSSTSSSFANTNSATNLSGNSVAQFGNLGNGGSSTSTSFHASKALQKNSSISRYLN